MRITIATSAARSADEAIRDVGEELGDRPDFLAVYHGAGLDTGAVAAAARGLGARAVHGGTSCRGVLVPRARAREGRAPLGALAIHDPDGDFATGLAAKGEDPRAAARQAVGEALAAAGRTGEAPNLVWLTATPGAEEEIIAGIQDVVGAETPVVGGSAADDDVTGRWCVIGGDTALTDGIAVSVLFPSGSISPAFQNGYAPTGRQGTVTRAEGRRLVAIDGRPAADVYAEWTGGADWMAPSGRPRAILAEATFAPLGRPITTVSGVPYYLLAHPATAEPSGAIELFATLEEGEVICAMEGSPDSLVARAGRVARQAVANGPAGGEVAGALVVYCGGCMLAVEDRIAEISDGVSDALAGAPFLGVFTFGEQGLVTGGANRHGNLMVSCLAFGT